MARTKDTPCTGCGKLLWSSYLHRHDPGYQPLCVDCRQWQMNPDLTSTCTNCGTEFQRRSDHKGAYTYCSADCAYADRQRVMRELHGTPRLTCEYCRSEFWWSHSTRNRFCSADCAHWAQRDGSATALKWHQCHCGRWLCRPGKKYCSPRCATRAAKALRKMRSRKSRHGAIVPELVFERDKWRCYRCGKKVNPNLAYPHKMSASVDHLIPLKPRTGEPGEDTYENVMCTHLTCNLSKGNRGGGEQLALLGMIENPPVKLSPGRAKKNGARVCVVVGCGETHVGLGFCRHHYNIDYALRHKKKASAVL